MKNSSFFFLFSLLLILGLTSFNHSIDNGLAITPPMGWNSWTTFLCNINENLIVEAIDTVKNSGLDALGYRYVVIDDCWQASTRDSNDRLQANSTLFPHGILWLSRYAQSKGLKLGIYSDYGTKTCGGKPGSKDHYEIDAQTFADWEIEYVKLDTCHIDLDQRFHPEKYYHEFSDALLNAKKNHPILFSICNWGNKDPHTWAPKIANMWRITMDIFPEYARVLMIIDTLKKQHIAKVAGKGQWNDPDLLVLGIDGHIGNLPWAPKTNLTVLESRSHFAIWSIMSAPLILSNDIRKMQKWAFDIISNKQIIAISQDALSQPGFFIYEEKSGEVLETLVCASSHCKDVEVFAKKLVNDEIAVAVFNRADYFTQYSKKYSIETVKVDVSRIIKYFAGDIHAHEKYRIIDSWNGKEVGILDMASNPFFESVVAQHDTQVYRLIPLN